MEASAPSPDPVADPVSQSNKIVLIVFGSILAVAALGLVVYFATHTSKEEKALQAVCTARADIATRVQNLASTTVTNFTVDGFKDDVNGIASDLKTIKNNQADLGVDRKAQIQQANAKFGSAVTGILKSFGTSLSIANAKEKFQTAGQQLIASYKQTLEPVDCTGIKLGS
ncbi:MAG: hypothetical protein QM648_05360 [Solirubrobacterales bacterium]